MDARGRLIAISAVALGSTVLLATGFALRDRVHEELLVRRLRSGPGAKRASALAELLEKNSRRALPYLLEQVLDPAAGRSLEATVHAREALRTGGRPSLNGLIKIGFESVEFTGIDDQTLIFLAYPVLRDAVQYSCVLRWCPYEEALEAAVREGDPALRAQALAVLLRVRAPGSVALQWRTLEELRRSGPGEWRPVLSAMADRFTARAILLDLARTPPRDAWSIRAAGVMQISNALPRLRQLSASTDLDTSLAAMRSLVDLGELEMEDLPGPRFRQPPRSSVLLAPASMREDLAGLNALFLRSHRLSESRSP